ncbi:hypothetical protein ABEB36_014926 [Hypothenemus hampei]|uniref:Uncharacterized protein n=1 Tax=Hypothenemus hampei TaxID=57062 RepID=A0ABD1E286_HYPHA
MPLEEETATENCDSYFVNKIDSNYGPLGANNYNLESLLPNETFINVKDSPIPKFPNTKKKRKVKILNTLDILISVFLVTPLVVACWRGTWQLMDIYGHYFPQWESIIIGTLVHIIVGISQETFDDLVNKPHKNWMCKTVAFIFMKLYTIVLNAVTNLHWRVDLTCRVEVAQMGA